MLELQAVSLSFGPQQVLHDLNLYVEPGEIMCLLGPSGCGKTTLLRVVAGLEQPDSGHILLNSDSIQDVPVHRRQFGLMFQDFALFPHMTVAENIAFGLRMQGIPLSKRTPRVAEVLERVGLSGFQDRDVARLSGGERQRVALARSLAPNPRLLMLDEPLGSVDAALRERLILDLRAIIKQLGLTAIYVTHDQTEAFAVADRVAVMNAGRIEHIDTPHALYHDPQTTFTARFLGLHNVLRVERQDGDVVQTVLGAFRLSRSGEAHSVLLHPGGIVLDPAQEDTCCEGQVESCVFLGQAHRITVRHSNGLLVRFEVHGETIPRVGDSIRYGVGRVLPLADSM